MNQNLEGDLRFVAQHLKLKLHAAKGHSIVQRAYPGLADRSVSLPILASEDHMGLPLDRLIRAAYSSTTFDLRYFKDMWSFVAALIKDSGWKPATPFFGAVAQMFPDLKLSKTPPRAGDGDVRGALAQALRIAHFHLPESSISVNRYETVLRISRDIRLGVASESITWQHGHYLKRNRHPIDFRQWAYRAPAGGRMLSVKTTALMQHLVASLPMEASEVTTLFEVVALLGPDAEYVICDPFDIVLSEVDDSIDMAAESAAIVAAQRKLKAF